MQDSTGTNGGSGVCVVTFGLGGLAREAEGIIRALTGAMIPHVSFWAAYPGFPRCFAALPPGAIFVMSLRDAFPLIAMKLR